MNAKATTGKSGATSKPKQTKSKAEPRRAAMDAAIDFNRKRLFVAVEVKDERANRMLATELATAELAVSKRLPQDCL